MKFKIITFLIIILYFSSSNSQNKDKEINNQVKIVDGDTIYLSGKKYRLHGIDAPEINQKCEINNQTYKCGMKAKEFLEFLVKDEEIKCKQKTIDRYKRIVAVCFVNDININQEMVRAGWAIAYRYYSKDFIEDEFFAENNRLGIWKGTFMMPNDWRRKNR